MNLKKLFAAAVMTTAVAAPAHAITWGEPDGDVHPHVVALIF